MVSIGLHHNVDYVSRLQTFNRYFVQRAARCVTGGICVVKPMSGVPNECMGRGETLYPAELQVYIYVRSFTQGFV